MLKTMTNRQKYILTTDNDCHWYLIPTEKYDQWNTWLESEDEETCWNVPSFAKAVDGPHSIIIHEYSEV
jgi:hypothetical protein